MYMYFTILRLKSARGKSKVHRCSTDSVESVKLSKITVDLRDCEVSQEKSVEEAMEASIEPAATHSVLESVPSSEFPDQAPANMLLL